MVEESAESQASVMAVVPVALLTIVTLLMMQLQNLSRVFLVLSVVPMGLIGVVGALLLFDKPLGFVAILGVLSLIGMIARNAVIRYDDILGPDGLRNHGWFVSCDCTHPDLSAVPLAAVFRVKERLPAKIVSPSHSASSLMGGDCNRQSLDPDDH